MPRPVYKLHTAARPINRVCLGSINRVCLGSINMVCPGFINRVCPGSINRVCLGSADDVERPLIDGHGADHGAISENLECELLAFFFDISEHADGERRGPVPI